MIGFQGEFSGGIKSLAFAALLLLALPAGAQSDPSPDTATDSATPAFAVAERGEDFAVYQKVTRVTQSNGKTASLTNSYVLLENSLHYWEEDQWKLSEDIIEPASNGAVASRGPHKAWFGSEMNSPVVFDLLTSDGRRLAGGVRSLQISDALTGEVVVIGRVKESVPGYLQPPNTIVFPDTFDGIVADVVYVWTHNHFSQSVILRSSWEIPEGFRAPVLDVVTEFIDPPAPDFLDAPRSDASVSDRTLINFGKMTMVRGAASPIEAGAALQLGVEPAGHDSLPVRKRWEMIEDGRTFLVESLDVADLPADSLRFPFPEGAWMQGERAKAVQQARAWPARVMDHKGQRPLELAAAPYRADGFVMDFELKSGNASSFTFQAGVTYRIQTYFSVGPGVPKFEPGCIIKYDNNAYLLLYGVPDFPTSAISPVFTAVSDDAFGEDIDGVPSTPTPSANPAISIYYVNDDTRILNARIRYAKVGIRYNHNVGVHSTHYVKEGLFEQITGAGSTAIQLGNFPASTSLSLVNAQKCSVTTSVTGSGTVSGTIADAPFCLDKSFAALSSANPMGLENVFPPPDTMAAVGPNHIVLLVNNALVVYNKSDGSVAAAMTPETFFGGSSMYDPRIVYDHFCNRWIALMVDSGTEDVILAVSPSSDPLPLSGWIKFPLNVPHPDPINWITDFPTLGYDAAGVYVAITYFNIGRTAWQYRVVAMQRTAADCSLAASKRRYFPPGGINYSQPGPPATAPYVGFTLQPAVNLDSSSEGLSWFVGKGDPGQSPKLYYGKLKWVSGNPQFLGPGVTPWSFSLDLTGMSAYYHLDSPANVGIPQKPPISGPGVALNIAPTGSRLAAPVVRTIGTTRSLWACHCIGVNSAGTYAGVTTGLRAGIQWIQLGFSGTGDNQALTFNAVNYGRVYDSTGTNPDFYIFPSIGVNATGDFVMGFSASQASARIGAGFWGRRSNGATSGRAHLFSTGVDFYSTSDFGHYSATVWDPEAANSSILWTIQEVAEVPSTLSPQNYATRIGRIRLNP